MQELFNTGCELRSDKSLFRRLFVKGDRYSTPNLQPPQANPLIFRGFLFQILIPVSYQNIICLYKYNEIF